MRFCSVINCMDGRVQLPVIRYMQKKYDVAYVDVITEPGPNLILSQGKNRRLIESIFERLTISVENHHSTGISIVGHHDCAGNPASKADQVMHNRLAAKLLAQRFKSIEITGLWVDENWHVTEVV